MPKSNKLGELATKSLSAIKPVVESTVSSHRYPTIYDCCVVILHCPEHNRFALCNSLHSGERFRWFPFAYMSPLETWDKVRRRTVQVALGRKVTSSMVSSVSCINVFRLQLPRTQRFVTRMIYYVRLNPTEGDPCMEPPKVDNHLAYLIILLQHHCGSLPTDCTYLCGVVLGFGRA